jgi:hypothetical protein
VHVVCRPFELHRGTSLPADEPAPAR